MRYAIKGRMWWRPVLKALGSIIGIALVITVAAVIGALILIGFIESLKTF